MILPGSQLYNLILLVFGMLCLGSWANTFRMTSKWRFELYCFDFAVGTVLAAVLLGVTFGSLGWDGFALADDLRIAGKQKDAFALAAGVLFTLGNTLILGGLSVAGVTVAYVMGVGVMLTSGIVLLHFVSPSGNGAMLGGGAALVLSAAGLTAYAAKVHSMERLIVLMREGKTKSTRKSVSIKGFILSLGGGLIASGYFPLVSLAREGENGLGPYSLGIFFAIGIAVSTLVFSIFFMNLPVAGDPIELTAYFQGKAKFHWLGVLGGMLFYLALASALVVARAEGKNVLPLLTTRAVTLSAALLGAAWGIWRWKEFAGASGKVKTSLLIALFLFAFGIVVISAAANISTAG